MTGTAALAAAINEHTTAVCQRWNVYTHNCAGDCAPDIEKRLVAHGYGLSQPAAAAALLDSIESRVRLLDRAIPSEPPHD